VKKSASKWSFQGGGGHAHAELQGILVSLVFNTVIAFVLCLVEFSKVFIKFPLRNDNVYKELFKISLCCDFLICMWSFICLEEV
jgi:hypothetical protein